MSMLSLHMLTATDATKLSKQFHGGLATYLYGSHKYFAKLETLS